MLRPRCVCQPLFLRVFSTDFAFLHENPYEPWVVRAYPGGGGLLLFRKTPYAGQGGQVMHRSFSQVSQTQSNINYSSVCVCVNVEDCVL